MNIVYYGVNNPMQFPANGYDNKKLILIASCGNLIKKEHQYIWKLCDKKCSVVKFNCYFRQGNKKKLLGTVEYRIKYPPIPKIIFGSTPEERENTDFGL